MGWWRVNSKGEADLEKGDFMIGDWPGDDFDVVIETLLAFKTLSVTKEQVTHLLLAPDITAKVKDYWEDDAAICCLEIEELVKVLRNFKKQMNEAYAYESKRAPHLEEWVGTVNFFWRGPCDKEVSA